MTKFYTKINSFLSSQKFIWIIVGIGVILRLIEYFVNRSLWLDESSLALNIVNRSMHELLQPLDHYQSAPIGFLILVKLLVNFFGNSGYILRLIPLLSGLVSLFLFYIVSKQLLKPFAVPIAVGLFAISEPLIRYSAEFKQYSSDVTFALLLILVSIYIVVNKVNLSRILALGIIGALAIWFSHPVVFVLTSIAFSLSIFDVLKKDWYRLRLLTIAYSMWLLSFIVCFCVTLNYLSRNDGLLNYWAFAFLPSPIFSISSIKWLIRMMFELFNFPVGLYLSGIAMATFLIGCIKMERINREQFLILILPVFFTFLAACFHKYPFNGRLLFFIVPSLILLIAVGLDELREQTKSNSKAIGFIFIALIFFHPIIFAFNRVVEPRTNFTTYHFSKKTQYEEIIPAINYIRKNWQPNDILFVYYGSQNSFEYYSKNYGFKKDDYLIETDSANDWERYVKDIEAVKGRKRVWILFSHICDWEGVDEEKFFLFNFDRIGTKMDQLVSAGSKVYLYDLSPSAELSAMIKN
jgi:hypothetical protein